MAGSGTILATRGGDGCAVTLPAASLRWRFDDLQSSEGHAATAEAAARVVLCDQPIERRALAATLLRDRERLTVADLEDALRDPVRAALETTLQAQPAGEAMRGDAAEAAMEATLRRWCFERGLALDGAPQVRIDIPAQRRHESEAAARRLAEAALRDKARLAEQAAETIARIEAARSAGAADVDALLAMAGDSAAALIPAILQRHAAAAPPERLALLASTALWIGAPHDPSSGRRIDLPGDLGPARSVQAAGVNGKPRLLIGARDGVLVLDPADGSAIPLPDARPGLSALGYHAADASGPAIFAAHGGKGLAAWDVRSPGAPCRSWPIEDLGGAPRGAVAIDERRFWSSAASDLLLLDLERDAERAATLPASPRVLARHGRGVVVCHGDGRIAWIEGAERHDTFAVAGAQDAESADWGGLARLVVAGIAVACVPSGTGTAWSYQSDLPGYVAVDAGEAFVAAVGADRMRAAAWSIDSWDAPRAVHRAPEGAGRLCDLCLI